MYNKLKVFIIIGGFLLFYFLPLESFGFRNPLFEALAMLNMYAREHVIFSLVPAFLIAGAIYQFLDQNTVLKYLGAKTNKSLAYFVASLSGSVLTVCSCTVLPLFSGIYKKGAGLGPAIAFLYSGPAINILALILTARVLGWQLGLARALGAIIFSVIIGLLMHFIFLSEEKERQANGELKFGLSKSEPDSRTVLQNVLYFISMIGFMIFANWASPQAGDQNLWALIFQYKWYLAIAFALLFIYILINWFKKQEIVSWLESSLSFALQILPLLFLGIFFTGLLLGRPGEEGLIPSRFVVSLVGGNSFSANFFASVIGAFMYFATLTEVPILQGLIGSGMGPGPALALLLAGPALSLPSMLVIRSVVGTKKTFVYVSLVIIMATISGMVYGIII
ncbi:MAG: permease [Candidatus Atribacteria bacterium]|nr:permease [Candidatus Atribacteria bacterium]